MTVATSVTSRTFQQAKSRACNAYLHYSTFSQENQPSQTEGRGVSLTVLPPPPLDLQSVNGGKPEGHATSDKGEKVPENDDPLAEYYAQARADCEAQVSTVIDGLNSPATCLSPSGIKMHRIRTMETMISTINEDQFREG